jgi:hypothetical protein
MSDKRYKIAGIISKVYTDLMAAENDKVQIDNELAKVTCYKVGQIVRIDIKEK